MNRRIIGLVPCLLSCLQLISGPNEARAQCEMLEDIKINASNQNHQAFGRAVALDQNVAVMGASGNCPGIPACGFSYVFRFDGNVWVQEAILNASDPESQDDYGRAVSVSGDVVVVGAKNHNCPSGGDCGAAYVYRYNGITWVEEQKLTASDALPTLFYEGFGRSVSVSGDTIVVGAVLGNCPDGMDCGSAYVYQFDGTTWIEVAKLRPETSGHAYFFGISVSISDDLIFVGSEFADCPGGGSCSVVYVYQFNGSTWVEFQKLKAFGDGPAGNGGSYGRSVSVNGNVAIVGANLGGCSAGSSCGSAYVYRFNGITWVEEQRLTASDGQNSDAFGYSVSINEDVIAVGAFFKGYPNGAGAAYYYLYIGGNWVEQKKLVASDETPSAAFGLATATNGDIILTGAQHADCPFDAACGTVYIYDVLSDCDANNVPDEFDPNPDGDCVKGGCDNCPLAPNSDQLDSDGDGVGDVCDPCPMDNPDDPDGDGVCSAEEGCPNDPNKLDPGICGCGTLDIDSDNDSVADCNDLCPDIDDTIFAPQCAEAIPAASTWGLLVISLLLITMAKVVFGRPRADAG